MEFLRYRNDVKKKTGERIMDVIWEIAKRQCKPFSSENEATKFSVEKGNKYNSPFTLLVSVESYFPEMMHGYQIQRKLRQITNVDIVRK